MARFRRGTPVEPRAGFLEQLDVVLETGKHAAEPTRRALESRGDVVWFDEDLETERLGPARGSGVLVREGGALKIAHYVLSLSIPNERFPDVRRALAAQGDAGAP